MNNVVVSGVVIVILIALAGSRTKSETQETVSARQLQAALHRIENRVQGEQGTLEIRVLIVADGGCATRSPLLCQIPLATASSLEIVEHLCPRLYQQVVHAGGVIEIEATRVRTEASGRTIEVVPISETLEEPPSSPLPICR